MVLYHVKVLTPDIVFSNTLYLSSRYLAPCLGVLSRNINMIFRFVRTFSNVLRLYKWHSQKCLKIKKTER